MLRDLLLALRHRKGQFTYWRHTYSPLSPWRRQMREIVEATLAEAARYRLEGANVDRRRAYQVARMLVPSRQGEHLSDLLPDAWLVFNPPSAATFHSGKRSYDPPGERRAAFRRHPQTLAYLLTPVEMARLGVGGSPPGGLVVIEAGEAKADPGTVEGRLRDLVDGRVPEAELHAYAEQLVRLRAGLPKEEQEEQDEDKAA